jgi:predicted RNA binding protein YcfA (HicA-like mRNA interferase family)
VPRLNCTYEEFRLIIEAHGFEMIRHSSGSHCRFRGVVNGVVRLVDWSPHQTNKTIPIGTLQSMIRQSGLPKTLFVK